MIQSGCCSDSTRQQPEGLTAVAARLEAPAATTPVTAIPAVPVFAIAATASAVKRARASPAATTAFVTTTTAATTAGTPCFARTRFIYCQRAAAYGLPVETVDRF
jgi:hypothetical protein